MFPLSAGFFNGLDGITYTNFQIYFSTAIGLISAFLAKQITNHKLYAIYSLAFLLLVLCTLRPVLLYFVVPYLAITAAPYVMAFQEVNHANT